MAPINDIPLFAAPLEIRWKIYEDLLGTSTHVFLHDAKLHIMPCEGSDDVSHRIPREDANMSDIYDPIWSDPIWIRRVESSWGCHWQCEEKYLNGVQNPDQTAHTPLLPLLLSSKTIFYEIVRFLSQPSQCIHFTDLETIDSLLSATTSVASSVPRNDCENEGWSVSRSFRNLGFTLRASLRLLGTLYVPYLSKPHMQRERDTPPRPFATPEGSGCLRQYEQWKRLWPSLLRLPHLQRFSFWLDHNEYYQWDLVNEREILQDLSDVMPGLSSCAVEVCVNLPRLPLESRSLVREEEYFVGEESAFCLQRRTRLPWMYANENHLHDGRPGVKWAENEENGNIPPQYQRNQISHPNSDWSLFDALGYDIESDEFEQHPAYGQAIGSHMHFHWATI